MMKMVRDLMRYDEMSGVCENCNAGACAMWFCYEGQKRHVKV
jgi:hypothetical protein